MKKFNFLLLLVISASVFSSAFAQRETPAGAGDKSLSDDSVKLRSVELERVKRDANKNDGSFAPINKEIKTKFPQIKEDFESIQISEAAIIKAYTTGKTIDYSMIQTSAEEINKKAKRLDENLFASKLEKKAADPNDKIEKPKTVRDLIVALDTAIGSFVSSKIFGNIKTIDADVAVKTRTDLLSILHLSEELSREAEKMK